MLGARSISCLQSSSSSPLLCERIILGNMFPSFYLAFYSSVRLFSHAVPRAVLEHHALTLRRVAKFDITREQVAECIGYVVTLLCVIFCVLSAKKDYTPPPVEQITALWLVGVFGFVVFFALVCWKGFLIFMDVRRLNRGE